MPGQSRRPAGPQPGQYGSPRRPDDEPSFGGQPGWSADEPSFGGQPGWEDVRAHPAPGRGVGRNDWADDGGRNGWDDGGGQPGRADDDGQPGWPGQEAHGSWSDPDGHGNWADDQGQSAWAGAEPSHDRGLGWPDDEPSYGGQQTPRAADGHVYGRPERHWTDDEPSYGDQPGWAGEEPSSGWAGEEPSSGWAGEEPSSGWAGEEPSSGWAGEEPSADLPVGGQDRPHKRRADVTAVDLGYTGRRSRPGHAKAEGEPIPAQVRQGGDDSPADQYWRQPADRDRW
jgi:hypothetical protein